MSEAYPVAHFQSETDASEETDVYSSNAEDIIIKEGNVKFLFDIGISFKM